MRSHPFVTLILALGLAFDVLAYGTVTAFASLCLFPQATTSWLVSLVPHVQSDDLVTGDGHQVDR